MKINHKLKKYNYIEIEFKSGSKVSGLSMGFSGDKIKLLPTDKYIESFEEEFWHPNVSYPTDQIKEITFKDSYDLIMLMDKNDRRIQIAIERLMYNEGKSSG